MKRTATFLLVLLAAACAGDRTTDVAEQPDASALDAGRVDAGPTDAGLPDAGCAGEICGDYCCDPDEICFSGTCCRPECGQRKCGPDGCGGLCGTCEEGTQCDPQGECVSVCEESDEEYCARLGVCGLRTEPDICGNARSVNCGCGFGQRCDEQSATCVCDPETREELCEAHSRVCGPLAVEDRCGAGREEDCGACPDGERCTEEGQCVFCDNDQLFCERAYRNCGIHTDTDACGVTRHADCGACPEGETCQAGLCLPDGPAKNEACGGAQELVFDARGRAFASGTVQGARDDFSACGESAGDLVYSFTIEKAQDVVVSVPVFSGTSIIHVARTCGDPEPICRKDHLKPNELRLDALEAGTYYVIVDDQLGTGGPFALEVWRSDPEPPPANDLCDQARELALVGGSGRDLASTRFSRNHSEGSCGAMPGGDVVYVLTLPEAASLAATVTRRGAFRGFEPAVYLMTGCGPEAIEHACDKGDNSATAIAPYLAAGTYYLAVDSRTVSGGDFELTVLAGVPVENDRCEGAAKLLFGGDRVAIGAGDSTNALHDTQPSCGGSMGPDLVFYFEIPPGLPQDVTVTAMAEEGSAFKPVLSVRRQCDAEESEMACNKEVEEGKPSSLLLPRVTAGVYYVWVDGDTTTSGKGAFSLSVEISDAQPPSNDACETPASLAIDPATGFREEEGTTLGAQDHTTAPCGTTTGPDVVYSLELATPSRVSARVKRKPTTQAFKPALYLVDTCARGAPADVRGCGASGAADSLLVAENVPAGTWYLVVDGLDDTQGEFTLEVSVIPHVENTSCETARPLVFDATGTATVLSYTGQGLGSSQPVANACGGTVPVSASSREAVFSFEVPAHARKDLSVTLVPVPHIYPKLDDAVLYLRGSCADTGSQVGCARAPSGSDTVTFLAKALPAGVYWLFADGDNAAPFRLTATLSDAASSPLNEDCRNAQWLDLSSGTATATGDTSLAGPDAHGTCSPTNGPDLVYSFSVSFEADVEVVVTPQAGSALRPVVYLRPHCDATSDLVCNLTEPWDPKMPPAPVTLVATRLPISSYQLFVDSVSALDAGPFSLQVKATPAKQPVENDRCQGAKALELTGSTATVMANTGEGADDYAGTCATSSVRHDGPDLVYTLWLDEPSHVVATVARDAQSPTYRPAVDIATSCTPEGLSDEKACGNEASGKARASAKVVERGTVYVVVDGVNGTAGGFSLQVSVYPPLDNDTCESPRAILLQPGTTVIEGDTADAAADARGSCSSNGGDLVYSFELGPGGPRDVRVQAKPATDSSHRPSVYLQRFCGVPDSELGCGYWTTSTNEASFLARQLLPGRYYLWVDSTTATYQGAFQVTVEVTDSTYVSNDRCVTAELLEPGNVGSDSALGSTLFSANDYGARCNAFTGGDNVYTFTITEMAKVTARVQSQAQSSDPAHYPGVYIRSHCEDPAPSAEVACGTNKLGTATAEHLALPAGTYYVIVDAASGTAGPYTLELITEKPVAGEVCTLPEGIELNPEGTTTLEKSNATATAASSGSCGGSGPERVYAFTLTAERTFAAEMTFTDSFQKPVLYLRSACSDAASELACNEGGNYNTTRIEVPRLGPGTYYLFADGKDSSHSGVHTLRLSLSAPGDAPANDACAGSVALAFEGDRAQVSGDNLLARDDAQGSCEPTPGPDRVYHFSTATSRSATITASRDTQVNTTFEPVVYVRSGCADATAQAEVSCGKASYGTSKVVLNATVPGAVYYVWVDGKKTEGKQTMLGGYTLTVDLADPVAGAPANDYCASAPAVAPGTTALPGTTVSAQDEAAGTCGGSGRPDVVYSVTLSEAKKLVAKVKPLAAYYPTVYIRKACGSSSAMDELACVKMNAAETAVVEVGHAPQGTYWIWVDSAASGTSQSGAFELDVQVEAAVPPPSNDTCAQAMPLLPEIPTEGDTRAATNDYGVYTSELCAGTTVLASRDVVFVYTPHADGVFYVTVTPTTSWNPSVWVGTEPCGELGTCRDQSNSGGSGGAEYLEVRNAIAGQRYYVFVEGTAAADAGPFTVLVQQ